MARRPRLDLPGLPQHIVQRGNDRQRCFREPVDRVRYLHDLRSLARHHRCAVHAYVLMDNHVHLLITPEAAAQVAAVMHRLAGDHARTFNARYGRTGSLWEGRYKASPVDSVHYLLRCYRYIELNPVRAGMTSRPEQHPWSSFRGNALDEVDALLTPHSEYLALGRDADERRRAYRALVEEGISESELALLRERFRAQHALGDEHFRALVESGSGRPAGPLAAGRPRRQTVLPDLHGPPDLFGSGG